jgi:hypothetical protein
VGSAVSLPIPSETPGDPAASAPVPRMFVVVVFAVAILAGALIAYYGITGHLGSGIP